MTNKADISKRSFSDHGHQNFREAIDSDEIKHVTAKAMVCLKIKGHSSITGS